MSFTDGKLGIGAAIAKNLASKGCSIVVNYFSAGSDSLADALVLELKNQHSVQAISARADVSSEEGCSALIAAAERFFGADKKLQIDILINNAAITMGAPLEKVTSDEFFKTYTNNVLGPIRLTQSCLPYLPHDRSGRIVNISSIGASLGIEEQTVYGGSKGALEAMTRVWARELAERATVNAVNPGPVYSRMLVKTPEHVKRGLARWLVNTPLARERRSDSKEVQEYGQKFGGRPAYVSEIAGVVAILCSADAGWTTGSVISANGGMKMSV